MEVDVNPADGDTLNLFSPPLSPAPVPNASKPEEAEPPTSIGVVLTETKKDTLVVTEPEVSEPPASIRNDPTEAGEDTLTTIEQPAVVGNVSTETETQNDTLTAPYYVEVPKLSEETLASYQQIPGGWEAADEQAKDEAQIIEIFGEYSDQGKRYLYAMYGDNILRRVSVPTQFAYALLRALSLLYRRRIGSSRRVFRTFTKTMVGSSLF